MMFEVFCKDTALFFYVDGKNLPFTRKRLILTNRCSGTYNVWVEGQTHFPAIYGTRLCDNKSFDEVFKIMEEYERNNILQKV